MIVDLVNKKRKNMFTTNKDLDFYFHYKKTDTYTYILLNIDFYVKPDHDEVYDIFEVYVWRGENKIKLSNISEKNKKRIYEQLHDWYDEDKLIEELTEEENENY